MVLIMAPAIDGLKKEWREAAENMGASSFQYWRHVALPVLLPSILGCVILLFGNAFGAQATAYQLTSGQIPLVTLLIGIQMSGDVLHDPNLAYALAMGMVFIMAISIGIYTVLQRRTGEVAQVSGPSIDPIAARAVIDSAMTTEPSAAARPRREGPGRGTRIFSWIVFILAFLYFFLPLYATFDFSLRRGPRKRSSTRAQARSASPTRTSSPTRSSSAASLYSFVIGVITIVVSIAIMVPTAYWVRLRLPFLRPYVEL